ncbi:MAG: DUF1800 domain-containing protein [Pseudomonadota bacterium]
MLSTRTLGWTRPIRFLLPLAAALTVSACGGGGGSSPPPNDPPPPPPTLTKQQLVDASRLTAAATFGMPYEAIEAIARQGHEAWLDAQFALPPSLHRPLIDDFVARREAGEFAAFENDIEFLIYFRRLAWWHTTVVAEDALRQRVAFALSQIFVVSDNVDSLTINPYALSDYYDTLQENAFGNFRDLLRDVSLHPAMGIYLSHLNNRRSNPATNTFPDENYAREVMQLFSIGLFELDIDGTVQIDGNGLPVPTYSNDDIREFAKVFTGLSFGGPGAFFGSQTPNFVEPMRMFDDFHEPGEKRLLNGTVVPTGQTGDQDIEAAIDNLFNHPNVGPFIGKQLIQRLVTSNPSPAYIERVARAFNGDGGTPRGDMRTVIRAVLLDPEAQATPGSIANFGKLREPVLRYTALLRQFNAESDDDFIANLGYYLQFLTRQHPLSAPSVFNFYLPSHAPQGDIAAAGLVAPEFQILNSNTVVNFANILDAVLFADFVTDAPEPFETVRLNFDDYIAIAGDVDELLERLDIVLTFGTLSDATRSAIRDAIEPFDDNNLRVRAAIYLIAVSADYTVRI